MKVHSKILSLALISIVVIAGVAGGVLWRHGAPAVELATGTLFSPSRKLPDFTLIDQNGSAFGASNLRGHWSLLFFGYTNCPYFCPTTLTTLAAMQKQLRAEHAKVLPQVVFVSVDAKRDTPAQLARFLPNFDAGFIGITAADQPSIEAVARQFGVAVNVPRDAQGDYAVDHTSAVVVLTPEARIAAVLTGPFTTDALKGDFERIVAAFSAQAARS
jgi:protein SCO1/2